jgi:hypothetical protein
VRTERKGRSRKKFPLGKRKKISFSSHHALCRRAWHLFYVRRGNLESSDLKGERTKTNAAFANSNGEKGKMKAPTRDSF